MSVGISRRGSLVVWNLCPPSVRAVVSSLAVVRLLFEDDMNEAGFLWIIVREGLSNL